VGDAHAGTIDRCASYSQEVRTQHARYFGIDYPWHYAVAQLQQESNCREVTSRDGIGSKGLPQITYSFWKKPLAKEGIPDIISVSNQLRAQAFINHDAHGQNKWHLLWIDFQIYNGGRLVLKEIDRAGHPCWISARQFCFRKVIEFDNGQKIDACEINYDYSQKIFKFADSYRIGPDSEKFKYW